MMDLMISVLYRNIYFDIWFLLKKVPDLRNREIYRWRDLAYRFQRFLSQRLRHKG